eukprot:CAMPEP_0194600648 /NCGR_PEP_ID=MMETSP0292-20121207/28478_1 /TAXON_ID=39354 /ORGANISM="Heterosigma akashiwo, Strain CCMP2393" /LENGTH=165 /DNA_ID=CAMNT_0039462337 /DNA_START=76 /DNA_END=569 /DNA_ORIENTATION=-
MKHAPPTTAGHRIHPTLAAARTKQKPRLPPALVPASSRLPPALAPASAARPRPRSEPPAPSPAAARPRRAGEPPPRPDAHGSERGAAALPPRLSPGPRPAAHLGSHVDVLPLVPGEGGALHLGPGHVHGRDHRHVEVHAHHARPAHVGHLHVGPRKGGPPQVRAA